MPGPDPQALRAALPPHFVREFDEEWALVMERAKVEMSLGPVQSLREKWSHVVQAEQRSPGSWSRMLEKAELIQRTGSNPDAASMEGMRALIARRLA